MAEQLERIEDLLNVEQPPQQTSKKVIPSPKPPNTAAWPTQLSVPISIGVKSLEQNSERHGYSWRPTSTNSSPTTGGQQLTNSKQMLLKN